MLLHARPLGLHRIRAAACRRRRRTASRLPRLRVLDVKSDLSGERAV